MTTSAPWTLKNEYNCLGIYCECVAFRKPGEADPPPAPKATPQPKQEPDSVDDDEGPLTPRLPLWPWP